jgi:hypothetical protein
MVLSYMQVRVHCFPVCYSVTSGFSYAYIFVTFVGFVLFLMHLASSFQADVSLGNEAAVPLSGRGGINTYIPLISK